MKKGIMFAWMIIGAALIAAGLLCLLCLKSSTAAGGAMAALPYICIGIGCGSFGHGTGELISKKTMKKAPELAKQITIEKNDERNIVIANCAKGKAYDAMIYIYAALLISFGLMGIPVHVILLLVFAYLIVIGISIYYRCKYDKEM